MEEWSALLTIAALAGVLLTLVGAWWMVRVLRARPPRPKRHREAPRSSDSAAR